MKINISDYKIEIQKLTIEDGGGYIALMPDLGCFGDGETIEEAVADVIEVATDLVNIATTDGKEIPLPRYYKASDEYSGKLTLRIPKFLHKQLSDRAEEENCSLNQLILSYLSLGIGNEFGKKDISIKFDNPNSIIPGISETIMSQWKHFYKENSVSRTEPNKVLSFTNFNLDSVRE